MPYQVSHDTQRLDVAYSVLSELIKKATPRLDTDFHVLNAARILVHAELLAAEARDRAIAKEEGPPQTRP